MNIHPFFSFSFCSFSFPFFFLNYFLFQLRMSASVRKFYHDGAFHFCMYRPLHMEETGILTGIFGKRVQNAICCLYSIYIFIIPSIFTVEFAFFFKGKRENQLVIQIFNLSPLSLLYNTGKTDGLTHTLGHFQRKAQGFESCRFA